jgi:2-polyprenyl-3-methyl-5-hydroxy-6-metoxy-1,4-benzoquinol methylase
MSLACPLCGGNQVVSIKANYCETHIYSCIQCLAEFCIPFSAPARDFYTNASDVESTRRHTILSKWHHSHPTYNSLFFGNGHGKTILDIGCGNGDFAEFACSKGFAVVGIDVDESSLQNAQSRGLTSASFRQVSLTALIAQGHTFDAITMFEVMEHLDNPAETLEHIKKLLKPKGLFIGSLPNENRFLAKTFNLDFAKPPYHLNFWTAKSWCHYVTSFHRFNVVRCDNSVYYGYLCNIAFEKICQFLRINEMSLVKKCIYGAFILPKYAEIAIEKLIGKSSSFYFEIIKVD